MSDLSRRTLLSASGLLALTPAISIGQSGPTRRRRGPKNIIWCVSDGMSAGVPCMLNQYLQRVEGKSSSVWNALMRRPEAVHGLMDTRSLSSLVTDSAAASSAWGSGSYVWNGMINTLPDGTKLRPLLNILKEEARMKIGLVTTTTVTHATPAGWTISHPRRDQEREIAGHYLTAQPDVLMGGGRRFFDAAILDQFRAAGYTFVTDAGALEKGPKGRMLGLFAEGHMPYEVDRRNDFTLRRSTPNLAAMVQAAIDMLQGSPEGFVLQVEGGRVDHAAHGNDIAGVLFDQLAFEEAVEVALQFAEEDGETLVVVTSDHGNSNPGLIGSGMEYFDSTRGLESVAEMTMSYERLIPQMVSTGEVADLVRSKLGVTFASEELAWVTAGLKTQHGTRFVEQYSITSSALALALSNHTHVGWSGRQHTSDATIVTAIGPGAEAFGGFIENRSVFSRILGLRGLSAKNPEMSWDDAHKMRDKVAQIFNDNHWIDA